MTHWSSWNSIANDSICNITHRRNIHRRMINIIYFLNLQIFYFQTAINCFIHIISNAFFVNTLFCCYLTRKWCIIFCLYVCIVEAKAREKSASLRFPSTLSMWSHSFFVTQHSIKRLFLYMNKFLPSILNIKRLNIYYETFITNLAR